MQGGTHVLLLIYSTIQVCKGIKPTYAMFGIPLRARFDYFRSYKVIDVLFNRNPICDVLSVIKC